MLDEVIKYCGHEYIFLTQEDKRYIGFKYFCRKCNSHTSLLDTFMLANYKIQSCNERIIKNILE